MGQNHYPALTELAKKVAYETSGCLVILIEEQVLCNHSEEECENWVKLKLWHNW